MYRYMCVCVCCKHIFILKYRFRLLMSLVDHAVPEVVKHEKNRYFKIF